MTNSAHPIRDQKKNSDITPWVGTDPSANATTGISISQDYTPDYIMFGIMLTAGSGNLDVIWENGSETIFPVTVDSGNTLILSGRFKTIKSSATTTFNGHLFPLF